MDGQSRIADLLDVPRSWSDSVRTYYLPQEVRLVDLLETADMAGAVGKVRVNPADRSVRLELYKGKRMLSVYKKGKSFIADEFEWRD